MNNRVRYGLRNVHYALAGMGGYAPPVPIPGAVSLSLSPLDEFMAVTGFGGIRKQVAVEGAGYDGTLEVALLPVRFCVEVLGERERGGVLREPAAPNRRRFALLFEFAGDACGIRHVFYCCEARRPNVEASTKAKAIEPGTETVNLAILPDERGIIKGRTTPDTPLEVSTSWYDYVH